MLSSASMKEWASPRNQVRVRVTDQVRVDHISIILHHNYQYHLLHHHHHHHHDHHHYLIFSLEPTLAQPVEEGAGEEKLSPAKKGLA
jgi:hypothetical protein